MSFNFAYLSGGRLYLKSGQANVQAVASEFGQAAQEREFQSQRRNSWKQKQGGVSGDISQQDRQGIPVMVQGVCSTSADRLLYTLEAGEIGGIFTLDREATREKRLFHSSDFKVDRVDFHREHKLIVCAVVLKDGTANIATMPIDAVKLGEVTEGDAIDLAPKWIPGSRKAIVFQSAGVSRNAAGSIIEQGHSTIEQLDFDRHEVITLASDPKYDLLTPQMTTNGVLYYIRRPYRPMHQRVRLWQTLKEVCMMPINLFVAVFEWLNFFTRRYTGKALLAPQTSTRISSHKMMFLGKVVDVGSEVERNRRFGDADSPALVPRGWELVAQRPHQEPEIIAQGVLAFDVGVDGAIVYSNGSAVYGIRPGGVAERLLLDCPIEQVAILDSADLAVGEDYDLN